MRRLAIFVIRRRWWVIAVALIALPAFALYGGGVQSKLSTGGFTDPGAESSRAAAAVAKEFPASGQSDFVVAVTAKHGTVNSPAVQAAGIALTAGSRTSRALCPLRRTGRWATSPNFGAEISARRSSSRRCAATTTPRSRPRPASIRRTACPAKSCRPTSPGRSRQTRELAVQAQKTLESDLLTGPFTFIALIIVFGSLVAAVLPLGVGLLAVLGTFVILTLLAKS